MVTEPLVPRQCLPPCPTGYILEPGPLAHIPLPRVRSTPSGCSQDRAHCARQPSTPINAALHVGPGQTQPCAASPLEAAAQLHLTTVHPGKRHTMYTCAETTNQPSNQQTDKPTNRLKAHTHNMHGASSLHTCAQVGRSHQQLQHHTRVTEARAGAHTCPTLAHSLTQCLRLLLPRLLPDSTPRACAPVRLTLYPAVSLQ